MAMTIRLERSRKRTTTTTAAATTTSTTTRTKRLAISIIMSATTATTITKAPTLTEPWFARSTTWTMTKRLLIWQQHQHQQ